MRCENTMKTYRYGLFGTNSNALLQGKELGYKSRFLKKVLYIVIGIWVVILVNLGLRLSLWEISYCGLHSMQSL